MKRREEQNPNQEKLPTKSVAIAALLVAVFSAFYPVLLLALLGLGLSIFTLVLIRRHKSEGGRIAMIALVVSAVSIIYYILAATKVVNF